jgi:hypothetical protein
MIRQLSSSLRLLFLDFSLEGGFAVSGMPRQGRLGQISSKNGVSDSQVGKGMSINAYVKGRKAFLAPEVVVFGVDFTGPYILVAILAQANQKRYRRN